MAALATEWVVWALVVSSAVTLVAGAAYFWINGVRRGKKQRADRRWRLSVLRRRQK